MSGDYLRERLESARRGLAGVHKALIDVERIRYERTHGRVDSPGQYLQLVIADPAFAWVRPVSSLMLRLDAMLGEAETLSAPEVEAIVEDARRLLRPDPDGDEFARLYDRAIQESPDVVLAHGAALALLEAVH